MKIGYFADGPWSHVAFDGLVQDPNLEIGFVCPRYDTQDPILLKKAAAYGIPVLVEENVNKHEALDRIFEHGCDLLVSMSFNQIFKKPIIELAPKGLINCHAGKLPFYRGRNILNWVLINDEREFGITVHYVDEGIDTGDIILQRTFPISDEDTYASLLNTAYFECGRILFDAVKEIQMGTATRVAQTSFHPVGMYCGRRQLGDERLRWEQPSRDVFNFVRAISSPGPNARSTIRGGEDVEIMAVEMVQSSPVYKGIPGQVVGKQNKALLVKTLDTIVKVTNYRADGVIRVGDRFE